MSQSYNHNDTIAAISTPAGTGGIGIVRLSGPQALSVAEKIFVPSEKKLPSQFASHTVHHGQVRAEDGSFIDEALLTVMRSPRSYTGEDVVELSGHGGPVVLKTILDLMVLQGARLAEPGEFTRRAFLNGRLDLVQAEAVLDIIQAKTESFLKISANQLKGELTRELEAIREQLLTVYSQLEAVLNFPEEDGTDLNPKAVSAQLALAAERIAELLASSDEGRIFKDGLRVVLCGRTNVGKSSLLNVLLRQPRAIVSPLEGTTRDTIEETVQIQGIPFQIIDTAGILDPRDLVEEEAVNRSQRAVQAADLVLFLLDTGQPLTDEDRQVRDHLHGKTVLVVVNKCDLKQELSESLVRGFMPDQPILWISATERTGIEELQKAIVAEALHGKAVDSHRVLVTNLRHVESLRNAQAALRRANDCAENKMSPEFISEEVRGAVNALDAITGRNIDTDLLDQIFLKFCIGK